MGKSKRSGEAKGMAKNRRQKAPHKKRKYGSPKQRFPSGLAYCAGCKSSLALSCFNNYQLITLADSRRCCRICTRSGKFQHLQRLTAKQRKHIKGLESLAAKGMENVSRAKQQAHNLKQIANLFPSSRYLEIATGGVLGHCKKVLKLASESELRDKDAKKMAKSVHYLNRELQSLIRASSRFDKEEKKRRLQIIRQSISSREHDKAVGRCVDETLSAEQEARRKVMLLEQKNQIEQIKSEMEPEREKLLSVQVTLESYQASSERLLARHYEKLEDTRCEDEKIAIKERMSDIEKKLFEKLHSLSSVKDQINELKAEEYRRIEAIEVEYSKKQLSSAGGLIRRDTSHVSAEDKCTAIYEEYQKLDSLSAFPPIDDTSGWRALAKEPNFINFIKKIRNQTTKNKQSATKKAVHIIKTLEKQEDPNYVSYYGTNSDVSLSSGETAKTGICGEKRSNSGTSSDSSEKATERAAVNIGGRTSNKRQKTFIDDRGYLITQNVGTNIVEETVSAEEYFGESNPVGNSDLLKTPSNDSKNDGNDVVKSRSSSGSENESSDEHSSDDYGEYEDEEDYEGPTWLSGLWLRSYVFEDDDRILYEDFDDDHVLSRRHFGYTLGDIKEQIRFIRPEGSEEGKDVGWCLDNGFVEIEDGVWSGHWHEDYSCHPISTELSRRTERIKSIAKAKEREEERYRINPM